MTRINENGTRLNARTAWSVLVIYEDAASREQAVDFCDQLVKRFWTRFEFDVSWWSFDLLRQELMAADTAQKAAEADLVVVSSTLPGGFPPSITNWIESWLDRRGDREGILAGLVEPGANPSGREGEKHTYLRQVAHRAAMDYLTQVPQGISLSIPESLDSYTERAARVTSVLDEILHHQAPPHQLS